MSLEEFLRGKGGLDGTGARLAYEDRWMVFSGIGDHWIVYQRKNRTHKTKVLYAGDPTSALEVLERGLKREIVNRDALQNRELSAEQA
jgi:hypothetical protein